MTNHKSDAEAPLLCPSAQPEHAGAIIFGVQTGPTLDGRRVAYLTEAQPVTDELLAVAAPAHPTEIFRVSAPCMKTGCKHFGGGQCSLISRVMDYMDPVVGGLPRCAIRPRCVWFHQEGKSACVRCPQVVTHLRTDTDIQAAIAGTRSMPKADDSDLGG